MSENKEDMGLFTDEMGGRNMYSLLLDIMMQTIQGYTKIAAITENNDG